MKNVKVKNIAPNQFIIETPKGTYFQSYDSVIAFKPNNGGKIQLDTKYWDYSATTSKYRNQFLSGGIAETRAKIANKEYKLVDLNK